MSGVFSVLPFLMSQILFVKGQGHAHFPRGTSDKPIDGKNLQFNLHDVVLEFLYDFAKKEGANVWDLDVLGENPHRPENGRYPVVQAQMSDVTLGAARIVSTRPMVAYTQLFHNGQPDRNETATIDKQIKHHNTYTFTVDRGIDTGFTGSWSAGIPDVVGAQTEISVKFSTLWGSTETKTKETTYSIKQQVNVPAESTVLVQMIITEEVVDVPWDATMDLRGYFAGYFEKGRGKYWRHFPIGVLRHPDVEKLADDKILFRATGTFHGITAQSSHTVTREKRHFG
uniref:Putative cytotoxin-like protein n=1 Tax=Ixodes ricinus TaxID=34613 RepID=A0A6B0V5Q5_IXORI